MHQSHDGTPARHTSVEDIAAHYLSEIRTIEPKGPYYLGGYCFGGIVAFEIAQQLKKDREGVALLVLLAPSTPKNCEFPLSLNPSVFSSYSNDSSFANEIQRHCRNLRIFRPKDKISYLLARTKGEAYGNGAEHLGPLQENIQDSWLQGLLGIWISPTAFLRSFYTVGVYQQALQNYVPKVYAGRIIILALEGSFRTSQTWENLAFGGIEIHEVHGTHTEVLNGPYVEAWAEVLKDQLDRAHSCGILP
jgi:pimeloyl-ACP methyl ester carboxylesterase